MHYWKKKKNHRSFSICPKTSNNFSVNAGTVLGKEIQRWIRQGVPLQVAYNWNYFTKVELGISTAMRSIDYQSRLPNNEEKKLAKWLGNQGEEEIGNTSQAIVTAYKGRMLRLDVLFQK